MKLFVRFLAVLGLVLLLPLPARAVTIYTDQSAFLAAVEAGYYLETFDSLAPDTFIASPLDFSGAAFSYTASAPSGFFTEGSAGDTWLATDNATESILFTFTSGNVTAVGGNFFASNFLGDPTGSSVVVTLNDGTSLTLLSTSPTSFAGFTSLIPILSLTVDAPDGVLFQWPTVNNLIVGQAQLSEPATLAMLGLGALFMVRRRSAARSAF